MNKVIKYYLRSIFFIFPIVFIPVVIDAFGFGKNIILVVMSFIALLLWAIKLITDKEKIVKTNKLFWLFSLFIAWSLISLYRLDLGSRMMSLMSPMGMGSWLSFFILFFVWMQVSDKEEREKQFLFLSAAGVITAITSLIIFLLPASKLPLLIPKTNPLLSITADWSFVGSLLGEVTLLFFLLFTWVKKLMEKIREKVEVKAYLLEAILTAFLALVLLLDLYRIFKSGWNFLDYKSAWIIAAETFKNQPIFGVGIGNFLKAFNASRPVSFNLTKYWAGTFSSSSMGILQIWTELGIVALLMISYLIAMVSKLKKTADFWKVVLFLAIALFLPVNMMVIFLLTWLLSDKIFGSSESKLLLIVGEKRTNVMPWILSIMVFVGVAYASYFTGRIFLGDYFMRQSLVAASKNDGTKTYELQIKAIGLNPYMASYRGTYSQVNMSLAQTLLSQENVGEEDKQKASALIQQAVREAKQAIALEQNNPQYWYNLAGIYKSLVGLVEGAADWSLQAYNQAIALDSVNPTYHLDLGGFLYAANDFAGAERQFEYAVTAKADYANAWYNWAYAAKQQNKLAQAVSYLEQALKLVPTDSDDYEAAEKDFESWKAELDALSKQQQVSMEEKSEVKEEPVPTVVQTPQPGLSAPQSEIGSEEKMDIPVDLSTE